MGKRISLYLIGFIAGCIVVYFMLIKGSDRGFSYWYPSKRVLDELRKCELKTDEHTRCLMNCYGVSEKEISKMLTDGEVIFDESSVHAPVRIYFIKFPITDSTKLKAAFALRDSAVVTIEKLEMLPGDRKCNC